MGALMDSNVYKNESGSSGNQPQLLAFLLKLESRTSHHASLVVLSSVGMRRNLPLICVTFSKAPNHHFSLIFLVSNENIIFHAFFT